MNKKALIAMITAGCILGANLAIAADTKQVDSQKNQLKPTIPVQTIPTKFVESDIFQTATLRPDRLVDQYHLSKYDVIQISVIGFEEGIGADEVTIGPDGYASLPYIGSVKLAGLTIPQAEDMLREQLGEYLKIPGLSIGVVSYGLRKVYVMGEVTKPGLVELGIDSMNAYVALATAGGATKRGRTSKTQVIRVVGDTLHFKELNIKRYITKHDITQNVMLEEGDIVYVPRSNAIIWNEDIVPYLSAWTMYKAVTE